ncbi:MAG: NUDIX hydrolase [Deltaproteobacteria bacterium]|nr:NUDIX hydrolase [Deltaproteobacteria bacterium]
MKRSQARPTPSQLERPILSVDVVLLHADRAKLHALLLRRTEQPFLGALALPGVAVRVDETLEFAARRALVTKTGLAADHAAGLHLEQVATFDALFRDPRGRTVTVAHMALSAARLPIEPGSAGAWIELSRIPRGSLPFDHDEILQTTLSRLRGKLRYTNIAARLLGDTFRLEELQSVYEAILGRTLNRSNFRTKLLKIGLIERAGVMAGSTGAQGGRPPHLFRFTRQDVAAEDREFV